MGTRLGGAPSSTRDIGVGSRCRADRVPIHPDRSNTRPGGRITRWKDQAEPRRLRDARVQVTAAGPQFGNSSLWCFRAVPPALSPAPPVHPVDSAVLLREWQRRLYARRSTFVAGGHPPPQRVTSSLSQSVGSACPVHAADRQLPRASQRATTKLRQPQRTQNQDRRGQLQDQSCRTAGGMITQRICQQHLGNHNTPEQRHPKPVREVGQTCSKTVGTPVITPPMTQ